MIAHEAKSAVLFRHWVKKFKLPMTCGLEMKDTHGKSSLPFSEVKQAQIDYARAFQSDEGVMIRMTGVEGLQDYMYVRREPSYIVIKYPSCFCIISPDSFELERKRSKRRSLLCSRAKDIATKVIEL